ncbi:MAG: hypothetical protein R3C19_24820 [Planctomycetaceae bacterium]
MTNTNELDDFAERAQTYYDSHLKARLESEHFGELIAVEPESGEYVLASRFRELEVACFEKFGLRPTHMFRIGGGGAVRVGGSRARIS